MLRGDGIPVECPAECPASGADAVRRRAIDDQLLQRCGEGGGVARRYQTHLVPIAQRTAVAGDDGPSTGGDAAA